MKRYLPKLILFLLLVAFLIPLLVEGIEIKNPLEADSLTELIHNIINFLFKISLPIGALMIVISAFYFLTSAGDPEKIKTAKDIIIWTMVGIIVLFLSIALTTALQNMLEVKGT